MSSYLQYFVPLAEAASAASGAPVAAGRWALMSLAASERNALNGSDASSAVVRTSRGRADVGTPEGSSSAVLASNHGTDESISLLCRSGAGFVSTVALLGGQTLQNDRGAVLPRLARLAWPSILIRGAGSAAAREHTRACSMELLDAYSTTKTGPRRDHPRHAVPHNAAHTHAHLRTLSAPFMPLLPQLARGRCAPFHGGYQIRAHLAPGTTSPACGLGRPAALCQPRRRRAHRAHRKAKRSESDKGRERAARVTVSLKERRVNI